MPVEIVFENYNIVGAIIQYNTEIIICYHINYLIEQQLHFKKINV